MIRTPCPAVLPALLLAASLLLPAPAARADLVIQGRAAQALHCAALMFMVSEELHQQGLISRSDKEGGQVAAMRMLEYVPGTDAQRVEAMRLRFKRIYSSRTTAQWAEEWRKTIPWCRKTFLR